MAAAGHVGSGLSLLLLLYRGMRRPGENRCCEPLFGKEDSPEFGADQMEAIIAGNWYGNVDVMSITRASRFHSIFRLRCLRHQNMATGSRYLLQPKTRLPDTIVSPCRRLLPVTQVRCRIPVLRGKSQATLPLRKSAPTTSQRVPSGALWWPECFSHLQPGVRPDCMRSQFQKTAGTHSLVR